MLFEAAQGQLPWGKPSRGLEKPRWKQGKVTFNFPNVNPFLQKSKLWLNVYFLMSFVLISSHPLLWFVRACASCCCYLITQQELSLTLADTGWSKRMLKKSSLALTLLNTNVIAISRTDTRTCTGKLKINRLAKVMTLDIKHSCQGTSEKLSGVSLFHQFDFI